MVEKQTKQILIVDDEINILNAVQRELQASPFARYRYETEAFVDPAAALARARAKPFDAVISDYRMPGMDGVEFLGALAQLQPDCARLVLSGQTDMAALVRMINETRIYHFVPKPWHDYYLQGLLSQALDYAAALSEHRRLAALVREHSLLSLPIREGQADEVLIVDDDADVLRSIACVLMQRAPVDDLLAALGTDILPRDEARLPSVHVQLARSAADALALAAKTGFSCVVADFRMPDTDAIELLRQFSAAQPDCARILIGGQIAKDDLIRAVDEAHIFAFLDTPWTEFDLKRSIALALSQRRMALDNRALAEMVRPPAA